MLRLSGLILFSVMAMLVYEPHAQASLPGPALDGFWSLCSNGHCVVSNANASLTTTGYDDVLVLIAQSKGGGNNVISVSDEDGHVWTLRAATGGLPIWEFYAIANAPLHADRMNVTWQYPSPPTPSQPSVASAARGETTNHLGRPSFPEERTA